MKQFYITHLLLTIFFISSAITSTDPAVQHSAFYLGEKLTYNVHYGALSIGTATMSIDKNTHAINEKTCYKIDVQGTTSPTAAMLGFKVNNTYRTYLDTQSLLPRRFYRHAHENNYILKEVVHFNHHQQLATVEELDSTHENIKCRKEFNIPSNVQDLVSGYYALRAIDTSKLQVGEKIALDIFFDETTYHNFQIVFLGKQILTTPLGTFKVLVFSPVLPSNNTIFAGKDAVEVFISDDKNKIPLKLRVNLAIGKIEMDLNAHQGLKNDL